MLTSAKSNDNFDIDIDGIEWASNIHLATLTETVTKNYAKKVPIVWLTHFKIPLTSQFFGVRCQSGGVGHDVCG